MNHSVEEKSAKAGCCAPLTLTITSLCIQTSKNTSVGVIGLGLGGEGLA